MHPDQDDVSAALATASALARGYLESLKTRSPASEPAPFRPTRFPDEGVGAAGALKKIWSQYGRSFSGNPGPRYWAFITGGVTPAALAGDWLTPALDQNVQNFQDGSAVNLERCALDLLRQLFELPTEFNGVFVSGGTMANFVGLAVGAQVLGRRRGVDVSQKGMAALPELRILSAEAHASIRKAAAMAGLGREKVESIHRLNDREAVDPSALRTRLAELGDVPVIIVANAGTVTTGDFDDLEAVGSIARDAGAYLHVDGAFGLFARITGTHHHLMHGLELADSVASDAHKFLNVPQEAGFVFTRHLADQLELFKSVSSYLPEPSVDPGSIQHLTPETSRRMRGLPVLSSLYAYGRSGHVAIVERCCDLASEMGERISRLPGFRLLAPVRYNVVCFELVDDEGIADEQAIPEFLQHLRADGRLFIGPSRFLGRSCIRFAIINWRTTIADLDVATEALLQCRWQADKRALEVPTFESRQD